MRGMARQGRLSTRAVHVQSVLRRTGPKTVHALLPFCLGSNSAQIARACTELVNVGIATFDPPTQTYYILDSEHEPKLVTQI